MKYLTLIVFTLLLAESFSVVVKIEKAPQTLETTPESGNNLVQKSKMKKVQVKTEGINFSGFPQMILRELNYYRRKNRYFPYIRWQNNLAGTAGREAQHIARRRSFGQHANFMTWKKQLQSRFFTELSLIVDTEGMVPNKRIFAKTIIEALRQEQEWYLIHPYTHAGVAIIPDKRRNHYVVVLHLIRRPSRVNSCRQARNFGIRKPIINIFIKNRRYRVACDTTTAGGGWTRIMNMNTNQYGRVVRGINDLGLHYHQVLFRAKPNYKLDYYRGHNNIWDFNGYAFSLNALRFGNKWYMSAQRPTHANLSNKIRHVFFNINDKRVLQVRKRASKCYFGRVNRPQYCATEFIFKKIPKGRLNAISEIESIVNKWTGDNQVAQYYQLYVR